MLTWGNKSAHDHGILFNVTRKNDDTYGADPYPTHPASWGFAGPSRAVGVVNVVDPAVTWVSGDQFNTSWASGGMVLINGRPRRISSVASATSLTLQAPATGLAWGDQPSLGTLNGASFVTGSPWDGNTDLLGYPCLDQPGRGQGDLITGVFPTKVNDTTSTAVWPNQALEPIYIWANSNVNDVVTYGNNSGGRVVANRDYYPQASGIQTSPTSPFNGTVGTGWGTLANRPTTCTAGVAYWATDQGDWNQSTSNPLGVQQNGADGVLYVATATDTWTLYYEPYTYPHPLTAEETSDSPRLKLRNIRMRTQQ
jgi:hypothetical protein